MIIELIQGVNWDTDLEPNMQTAEALMWVAENVQTKIAYSEGQNGVQPERDEQNRPIKWVIVINDLTITRSIVYTSDTNYSVSLSIEKTL